MVKMSATTNKLSQNFVELVSKIFVLWAMMGWIVFFILSITLCIEEEK